MNAAIDTTIRINAPKRAATAIEKVALKASSANPISTMIDFAKEVIILR